MGDSCTLNYSKNIFFSSEGAISHLCNKIKTLSKAFYEGVMVSFYNNTHMSGALFFALILPGRSHSHFTNEKIETMRN